MNTEVTAVERITFDGTIAALLVCDAEKAQQRINTLTHTQSFWSDEVEFEMFAKGVNARTIYDCDGIVYGLRTAQWNLVLHERGIVIGKTDDLQDQVDVEMETDWIDLLAIVRRFFALDLTAEPKELEEF